VGGWGEGGGGWGGGGGGGGGGGRGGGGWGALGVAGARGGRRKGVGRVGSRLALVQGVRERKRVRKRYTRYAWLLGRVHRAVRDMVLNRSGFCFGDFAAQVLDDLGVVGFAENRRAGDKGVGAGRADLGEDRKAHV